MTDASLANLIAYSGRVLIVVAAAAGAAAAVRMPMARARVAYWRLVFALCLVLPFLAQPAARVVFIAESAGDVGTRVAAVDTGNAGSLMSRSVVSRVRTISTFVTSPAIPTVTRTVTTASTAWPLAASGETGGTRCVTLGAPDCREACSRIRSGSIRTPRLVSRVEPVYPPAAKAANIQGVVILEVVIGTDGTVKEGRVLRSISLLDQAALDAVVQWKYEPTLLNGAPVEVIATVTLNFTLP